MTDELSTTNVIDGEVVEPKPPTEREKWIAGVRALASFVEAHPELPMSYNAIDLFLFPKLDEMRKYVSIFGRAKKDVIGDDYFKLDKVFYDGQFSHVKLSATWQRGDICEKVKTGTKKVMQTVQVKPPETIQVETEVETFEWKCPKVAAPPAELVEGESDAIATS